MEKSYFLSMTFNNIVFRGRNKAYGAYYLRRKYSKHMLLASTLATAVFSGALVGPLVDTIFFSDQVKYVKPTYTIIEPVSISLPLPPKPDPKPEQAVTPPPAPPAKEKVATERYVTPRVVDDATPVKEETVPNQEELAGKSIGYEKIEGSMPDVPPISLNEEPPMGVDGGTGALPADSEPYVHVDQMPQFKGGTGDLMQYLSRKLRYPAQAQSNGIEGTVVVTFVVGTTGEITDVKVLKGLGFGTEEEATRVVKNMPKWEPGRQNGRAVPVRYTLPIRFKMK
ncbi:energy transducer TonB [Pontibacter litorisediminis]|uniref:energy transducer TonB n=1 Tax=Pontibacter litorisediminis TaxID=1846260 RepID=UPI0023EBA78E|nr:energy transducer TonB [Pontibacter litorisediminis]